jgi:HSP20 family molecular chaperone IbpA
MHQLTHFNGCFTYPGWHVPSIDEEELFGKFEGLPDCNSSTLPVTVQENQQSLKIVVPVGRISKEDIVLYTHGNSLFVASKKGLAGRGFRQLAGTSYCYGSFLLPENTDPEFACAEYRNGTIEISLSKNNGQTVFGDHQIIVY